MNTPDCKVHNWTAELAKLREIILECGLDEELKWGVPCYTFQRGNILLLSAFNDYCAISFFKGSLLKDPENILVRQTENVQATRQIRFTNLRKIIELESILKDYIFEAVEIEKAGLKPVLKNTSEFTFPEELQNKLDADAALKIAFDSLTPGRQRAYLLYFSQPKQSRTRHARIEKYTPQILMRKGLNDR
jgi:uncharacterized protein YdeI (YjbR/CyaY-like superfamily)